VELVAVGGVSMQIQLTGTLFLVADDFML